MQTRSNVVAVVTLCSLFMLAWLLPRAAATEEARERPKPLAEVAISASRVDWQPVGDHERLTLTVAGPGDLRIQREVGAGEALSFSVFNAQGGRLLDGVYAYELRTQGGEVQWGHLWVKDGSFMDKVPAPPRPVKQAAPAARPPLRNVSAYTEVIADDLAVQGQACIGADCEAADAAGAALKIKESGNYQLRFDGLNCCLPSEHIWTIQANGSDNNGLNGDFTIRDLTNGKIPFRIAANSPDNSFTIFPGNGNIGLGTLTPAVRLDVKANATGVAAARLQNSSSTGYSGIEYLDNAGNVDLFLGVDNNASTTRFNSINNNPIVLFTNSVEHVRVDSDGDVGINCNNPTSDLVIASGSGCSTPSSSINAGSSSFTTSSSRTIKENLAPVQVPGLLDRIAKVDVFRYDFIQGPKDRLGLMAEDFHQIFGRGTDKMIDGQEIQMALWLAVQELTALNKELRDQNTEIRKRLADVEAHLPVAPQQ